MAIDVGYCAIAPVLTVVALHTHLPVPVRLEEGKRGADEHAGDTALQQRKQSRLQSRACVKIGSSFRALSTGSAQGVTMRSEAIREGDSAAIVVLLKCIYQRC